MELVKISEITGSVPIVHLLVEQSFDPFMVSEIALDFFNSRDQPYFSIFLQPDSFLTSDQMKFHLIFHKADDPNPEPKVFYLEKEIKMTALLNNGCYLSIRVYTWGNYVDTNKLLICIQNSPTRSTALSSPTVSFTSANSPTPTTPVTFSTPINSSSINPPPTGSTSLLNLDSIDLTTLNRSFNREIFQMWTTKPRVTATGLTIPSPRTQPASDPNKPPQPVLSITYMINQIKVIKTIENSTMEFIFNDGDQFLAFVEVKAGKQSDLDYYSLIFFDNPNGRSYLLGPAGEPVLIEAKYTNKYTKAISIYHPNSKRHRKLFTFSVKRPENKTKSSSKGISNIN